MLFLIFTLVVGALVTLYNRHFGETIITKVNSDDIEEFKRRSEEINTSEAAEANATFESFKPLVKDSNFLKSPTEEKRPKETIQASKYYANFALNIRQKKKFLININTANQEELQNIPHVGPVTAQKIIDFRQKNGKFKSIEELIEVKGIGKVTLKKIRPYISIN
ncbi:MAG: ComEA family DNA-binding protein [bacterium]